MWEKDKSVKIVKLQPPIIIFLSESKGSLNIEQRALSHSWKFVQIFQGFTGIFNADKYGSYTGVVHYHLCSFQSTLNLAVEKK